MFCVLEGIGLTILMSFENILVTISMASLLKLGIRADHCPTFFT